MFRGVAAAVMLVCAPFGCAVFETADGPTATVSTSADASARAPAAAPLLLRGATVMTGAGPTLERADVLVENGRISRVGADLVAKAGVQVVDATGRWITPGIIDPHSHLGVYAVPATSSTADGNEITGPFKPDIRAEDSFGRRTPRSSARSRVVSRPFTCCPARRIWSAVRA